MKTPVYQFWKYGEKLVRIKAVNEAREIVNADSIARFDNGAWIITASLQVKVDDLEQPEARDLREGDQCYRLADKHRTIFTCKGNVSGTVLLLSEHGDLYRAAPHEKISFYNCSP